MTERRIAVVTGASSGVGAAVVKRLSARDCQVIMLARDIKRMELVAGQCEGITPLFLDVDLRNTDSVNDVFDTIKNKFGYYTINGPVKFPGEHPIIKSQSISNIILNAGGFKEGIQKIKRRQLNY